MQRRKEKKKIEKNNCLFLQIQNAGVFFSLFLGLSCLFLLYVIKIRFMQTVFNCKKNPDSALL